MQSPRSFIYTAMGMVFFVILPFFLIASNHLKKDLPGSDCTATNVSGCAAIQYQVAHIIDQDSNAVKSYNKTSQWIPLQKGAKIAYGALIKTAQHAVVDIMIKNLGALRITEQSSVKLEQINKNPMVIDLALNEGRVFSRVIPAESKESLAALGKYRVRTPIADVRVQGTTFSVDYLSSNKSTQVAVLDGVVHIKSNDSSALNTRVHTGEKIQIAPFIRYPQIENISEAIRQELLDTRNLKFKETGADRWNEIMGLVVASPFFNKALTIITRYEMNAFKRAILCYARLEWNNTVPGRLQAVELENGDYQDPWDSDYYYEKIQDKKAVLISAGPDRILHTQDDIFVAINL